MRKELFLITHSDIGGAGKHVLLAAQRLKKQGIEVVVGTRGSGWLTEEMEKQGIPVVIFGNLKRSLNPIFTFLFILELRRFLKSASRRKEKVDVINFNSSNPLPGVIGLVGLKNKPRTIFTAHGSSYLDPGFKKSKIAKAVVWLSMKIALLFIDEIIFVCNYDKNLAVKLKLVTEKKTKVVYNEVGEINFLSREEARSELRKIKDFPDGKIIIGTITRLEYAKNNEMLIEAINKLPKEMLNKIICVIIGDGPDKQNLKSQVSNLKISDKILFLGEIPEAAKYLRAFNVFVMTSRYEGMPYTLLEAMSAGVPIIATRVGGIPEILEDKGVLIEPDNVEDLTASLADLLSGCSQNNHNGSQENRDIQEKGAVFDII